MNAPAVSTVCQRGAWGNRFDRGRRRSLFLLVMAERCKVNPVTRQGRQYQGLSHSGSGFEMNGKEPVQGQR